MDTFGFGIGVGILLFVCIGLAHSCIYDMLMHARESSPRRSRRLETQRIRVAA
jgi:hypothetical protein